jgi:hypothetical protein
MKKTNKGICHQIMEAVASPKSISGSELMGALQESAFSTERVNSADGYHAIYIEGALVERTKDGIFVDGKPATDEQRRIICEWADRFIRFKP